MRVSIVQVKANDLQDFEQAMQHLENNVIEAAKHNDLILVPECAFPSYFIHENEGNVAEILNEGDRYLQRFKEIAKDEQVFIAYGYCEKVDETIYNSASLFDRNGNEVLKKRKSFLWHFDSNWFVEGEDVAVANTEFGKVALIICADARMPEIVKLTGLEDVDLIIDLANLTATGSDITTLQNPQSSYMLSVRAMENHAWLAVSNKWGVEVNSISYAGRSSVFSPDGSCLYQADSNCDEIVSVEIPTDDNGKIIRPAPKYDIKRRPELYKTLSKDIKALPILEALEEKVTPVDITPYITVVSGEIEQIETYNKMIQRLVSQGSDMICMPPTKILITEHLNKICALLPNDVNLIATYEIDEERMVSYIISNKGIEKEYQTLHHEDQASITDATLPVFQTKWGKIGIMHNKEALLPEFPRSLMLLGADCIVWPNKLPFSVTSNVGRTRAAENKVFIVAAYSNALAEGASQIIDPNGNVNASTLLNENLHACSSFAPFSMSRVKEVVPGTSVVKNRRPKKYGGLTV